MFCRRGATEKGAGFVSRFMLVRIQSSALLNFVSDFVLRISDLLLSSVCAGFARDPAKVEDQVQFLARTLN